MTTLPFLSTLSLRRATAALSGGTLSDVDFYPRSPCGERPSRLHKNICGWGFLSTLSLRRATSARPDTRQHDAISIHALLAESDRVPLAESTAESISIHALLAESDRDFTQHPQNKLFLSTLSLRRATAKVHKTVGHFCAYETNFMGIASSC